MVGGFFYWLEIRGVAAEGDTVAMPEILKKKSPAKRLYWSDIDAKWPAVLVAIASAIYPFIDGWSGALLAHAEPGWVLIGGFLVAVGALIKPFLKDNTKDGE